MLPKAIAATPHVVCLNDACIQGLSITPARRTKRQSCTAVACRWRPHGWGRNQTRFAAMQRKSPLSSTVRRKV